MTGKSSYKLVGAVLALTSLLNIHADIIDWSGSELDYEIGNETRIYAESPAFPDQLDTWQNSFVFEAEWFVPLIDGNWEFTAKPFYRHDFTDGARTHFDFREFHFRTFQSYWELTLGLQKIFWGVTESQHLVDIINQTDLVENPDGEDKLGQPMIQLTLLPDWGTIDLFIMPYFRERTFPGAEGRLRANLPVIQNGQELRFRRTEENDFADFAVRYSHYIGSVDFGISYFRGMNREAELLPAVLDYRFDDPWSPPNYTLAFEPRYRKVEQFGLDFQLTQGGWLWKLEGIYRNYLKGINRIDPQSLQFFGPGFFSSEAFDDFGAVVGGFEYTFVGVFGSDYDVGVLAEYHYESIGRDSLRPFNNDLFWGARITPNDTADTALLIGGFFDMYNGSQSYRVEFSRRLGDNYTIIVEGQTTANEDVGDPLFFFRNDSFLAIELRRFF